MENAYETRADQLVYKITHNLSEPIRALVELPQWIVEDIEESSIALPEDVQDNLKLLTTSGKRLEQMVDGLLAYSRVGRNQTMEPISLNDLNIDTLLAFPLPQTIRYTRHIDGHAIQFNQPDFKHLCQILLSNALKHGDAQTSRISLTITKDCHWIEVCVVDDGPGIPWAQRETALGVLTTLKPQDEVEGSGMGLAIAHRIATSYDGTITLEDAPNTVERGLLVRVKLRNP